MSSTKTFKRSKKMDNNFCIVSKWDKRGEKKHKQRKKHLKIYVFIRIISFNWKL